MNDDIVIEARGLTKRFGDFTAVDHVDLDVPKGRIYGFLGPNGSGKSTTIRMLCGLLTPTEGTANVLGTMIPGKTAGLKPRIGYMTQSFSLFSDMTVLENLQFIAAIYSYPMAKRKARIEELLERYTLTNKRHALAGSMSGGQRHSLALACAVLHHPELLLLDEPTSAVDPQSRRNFWANLFRLAKAGTTILLSTHYMDEAERCHRLAILARGAKVADGTPEELQKGYAAINHRLAEAPVLSEFAIEPQDWRDLLDALAAGMAAGTSRVVTDTVDGNGVKHLMPAAIRELLESAEEEVLITNAYIIPNGKIVKWIGEEVAGGVRYRILTNSLASHDVPAVNAHYRIWRDDLLKAGVELYETRPDAAARRRLADSPPVESRFMGLHVKAMIIDRRRVFIGSMNLDPRSWAINSEMGVVVESPALAKDLAAVMDEDVLPENAWRLELGEERGYGEESEVLWVADDGTLRHQPARSGWQRFQDFLFAFFPRSLY